LSLQPIQQADPRAGAVQPMPGVTAWTNRRNRVRVIEVHYTADPAKRTDEWKRQAKAGMPERGWAREMEIAWEIPEGEPVFPEYVAAEMRRDVPFNPQARLLRFWDFGHVCPVTLFAQLDLYGRLIFQAELVLTNSALEQQIESTMAMSYELMGRRDLDCFDAGDPAGEKEMDLGQCRNVLMKRGIVLHCRPSNAGSYENFRSRLLRRVQVPGEGVTPACIVTPRCPTLHSALAGGFHRNPKTGKAVDVHPYKDVCDAARYGNDNLEGATSAFFQKLRAVARQDAAW